MKVKDLAGTLNTVYNRGTKFYFNHGRRTISKGVPLYLAYKYWGEYSILSWFVGNTTSSIIVFIDPDERRR